jgi:hypothetical protein
LASGATLGCVPTIAGDEIFGATATWLYRLLAVGGR